MLMMAGTTAQAGWLFVMAAGVFALLLASYVFPHRLDQLEIHRELPRRLRVGDDANVKLRLTNTGRSSIPMLRLEDRIPAFEPVVVASEAIPGNGVTSFENSRVAHRRGDFDGGHALVRGGAPFGLGRTKRSVATSGGVTVVPRWVHLRTFPLVEPSATPSEVEHDRARSGAGEEYIGVRDYRPGDPRKAVHWRTSARAGKLVVREFEEHVLTRVAVVVAGMEVGEPPDSAFERVVSAAASVAHFALGHGHPVELLTATDEGIDRLSTLDRRDVLDALARVQPSIWDPAAVANEALHSVQRRGPVVLCVTSRGAPESALTDAVRSIRAGGARPIVVVADGSSWEHEDAAVPDPAMSELDRVGGIVRVLRADEELEACLRGS